MYRRNSGAAEAQLCCELLPATVTHVLDDLADFL